MLKSLIKFFFGRREADGRSEQEKIILPASWTDGSVRFAAGDISPDTGKIDPAFDNYSGELPPDWDARRIAVMRVDNFTCQAPGCLANGTHIQVHHIQERWRGGTHRLANLVSLCPLHHALVHLATNRLEFKDARYVVVSRHWRRKPFSSEKIAVRSFVRRFELITPSELQTVRVRFNPECHWCGELDWKGNWRERENLIWSLLIYGQ